MALIGRQRYAVGFEELKEAFGQRQEVSTSVAQSSQPIREVQRVCEHAQQIVNLQPQITDLQTKQFVPPQHDHTELDQRIEALTDERDKARRRTPAAGTDQELQEEAEMMTRDARQLGEEVRSLTTQLENALALAVGVALAAHQAPDDRGL